ncbi:hypothetical protein OG194_42950 [Streptomyces sp. NBC_01288]|uniref:hypothetical protein n=1 Tax=Streptomyces sp. NBC_01288 TaxID=2903814 RepID=UPI002E152FB2|nr:hypothetical protein OG194_42950 [Streptomyces sp. NBC_01288]
MSYTEDPPIACRYWRRAFGARLGGQTSITVPEPRGVPATVVPGARITVLPRHLRLAEPASGALVPLPLPTPEDPPIATSHLTRHPASPDNPHVTLVQERPLPAAPTR